MATPFVVTGDSDPPCRLACSSWCPMCERTPAGPVLAKSLVDDLRKDEGLAPYPGPRDRRPDHEKGVHEKYVKEVEALKGKIQELRENLSRQFSESENIISSIPKLLWNKEESSCCEGRVTRAPLHEDNLQARRSKRLVPSEAAPSPAPPPPPPTKRPRDFSPQLNPIICDKPVSNASDSKTSSSSRHSKSSGPSPVKLKDQTRPTGCCVSSPAVRSVEVGPPGLKEARPAVLASPPTPLTLGRPTGPCPSVPGQQSGPRPPGLAQQAMPCSTTLSSDSVKSLDVTRCRHPSLRASLFPSVPPYINFVYHDSQVEDPLPAAVSKVLRWKITTITPLVVRKTVVNSGFKLVKQSSEWTGTWGKHMKSIMFRTIRESQKMNHFPGTFQIGRKDKLWRNLHHLMMIYSKKEFGFIPRTYILPQDVKLLRIAWERDGGTDSTWIVKPPASARGTGIKVVSKWSQIPKKAPIIVQKYIANPYLINGNKFDLRLYALVTGFNPLRIYLYDNGLVRFASVKYSEDVSSLSDRYMHLTNYSINKLSNNYHHNEDADACQGHKWTIKTLFTYLQEKVDVKVLWERLVDLVIKTMICGESSICSLTRSNLTSHYCSYELFGVDVLLDEHLTPWLLEVNISPSLHSASPLDLAVKGPLIRDILNIAGYQIPDNLSDSLKREMKLKLGLDDSEPLCYNRDLYVAGLTAVETVKHKGFHDSDRSEYLEGILSTLTPDDIRHLIRYEDELTQIGSFEKVFPTQESYEYLRYFESPQYYNKLFDAWETKYANNREQGIQHLQDLCAKGYHLDVQDVLLHVSPSASEILEGASESTLAATESAAQQRSVSSVDKL